ncbi:hypothetical protein AVEN_204057-1 [Araneus ventricosus]|uniref:Uncharacterized protein n=1 Tax=Araneus ventricosus TaxID=182803 RepID=A0A4Y2TQT2_ARAVE|nr:hypothetical protein AVEN_204057-1 [Araneus ventricosus]
MPNSKTWCTLVICVTEAIIQLFAVKAIRGRNALRRPSRSPHAPCGEYRVCDKLSPRLKNIPQMRYSPQGACEDRLGLRNAFRPLMAFNANDWFIASATQIANVHRAKEESTSTLKGDPSSTNILYSIVRH